MLRFIALICMMSACTIHVSPKVDAQPYGYDLEHFVHAACVSGTDYIYMSNDDDTRAKVKVLPIFDSYGDPITALTEDQVADMKLEACGFEGDEPEETWELASETDRTASKDKTS